MKSRESSKFDVLATAALIHGVLKHGKTADINHIHMSFAHFRASVLK